MASREWTRHSGLARILKPNFNSKLARHLSPSSWLSSSRPLHTRVQRRSFLRVLSGARAYSTPIPKTSSSLRYLKTTWKITCWTALAGMVYTAWAIYDTRHPAEQAEPDPSKKTLVILGSGWGSIALLRKLDTSHYNVVIVSPRNFFLFTPLLPSCTTGTVEHRSIMEPVRGIIRHKDSKVTYYEAEATGVDHERRVVKIRDAVEGVSAEGQQTREIPFDYLVIGVGAQTSTFGIPGVQEHACFLKEIPDAQRIRKKIMDCIEKASFKDASDEERKRLLHTVVVGGGPTGVEFAAELRDFFEEDLKKWIPDIAKDFKVTLVEALPNVLPSFSKRLIDYTENVFQREHISVLTKTMVKKVDSKTITGEVTKPDGTKELVSLPYGLLVWATGNAVRPVVRDLMSKIPAQQNSRRGLLVNDFLVVEGTDGIWCLGDCSATKYAPTAQVASQEGIYLAGLLNQLGRADVLQSQIVQLESKQQETTDQTQVRAIAAEIEALNRKLRRFATPAPFKYNHQGSLAYIGSDEAVADVAVWGKRQISSGGVLTYIFWRSSYISMCFSTRNKVMVILDWLKVKLFGRDVSRE